MNKKLCAVLITLMLGCLFAGNAFATPYPKMDVAEFTFQGSEYSDASILGDWAWVNLEGNDGGLILSYWKNMWVEYTAELFPGSWNIGLNASNFGNLGTGWYDGFMIDALLFDSNDALIASESLLVPASSTEINHDFFNIFISEVGAYTVRYTWLNDKWDASQGYDANIIINSAFFHDPPPSPDTAPVPEPATMLLLGTGLIGVASAARRRKKNLK